MGKFCTRCGSPVQAGDLFCGECGAKVPGAAADVDEPTQISPAARPQDDFFADWDEQIPAVPPEPPPPPPHPDEAATEAIPAARPHDTAVLPAAAPPQPFLSPGPPQPAVPVAPPPAATAPARRGFPLGATFALVGALAVVVSALIPWTGPGYVAEVRPRDVAFLSLLDPNRPETAPSLGLVLLGAGLLGALVALFTMVAPILKFLRRIIGLLTLAVVGFFVFRLVQELLEVGAVGNILSALGVGAYVAAAGAFTQMIAGKWFGR